MCMCAWFCPQICCGCVEKWKKEKKEICFILLLVADSVFGLDSVWGKQPQKIVI